MAHSVSVLPVERLGWQHAAVDLLARYLDTALTHRLPPPRWTVTADGGSLIAHCDTVAGWLGWQRVLQLPDSHPPVTHAGWTQLRSTGLVVRPGGAPCHVTLIADIDLDRDPQAGLVRGAA